MTPLVATTLLSTAATIVSCGKDNPSQKLNVWLASAKNASASDIVKNTKTQALDWVYLANIKGDLTKGSSVVKNGVLTYVITSKSKKEQATFCISAPKNYKYNINNWKCSVQPKSITKGNYSWLWFSKVSGFAKPIEIIKNAQNTPTEWASLSSADLIMSIPNITKNMVTVKIKTKSKNEVATFVINYTSNRIYQVSDWVCTIKPAKINKEVSLNKIGNSDFSNIATFNKIDSTYYAGGNQGLWTSSDGEKFTKNAIPVLGDNNGDGWVSFVKKIDNVIYLGEDGSGPQSMQVLGNKVSSPASSFGLWTSSDGEKFTQNISFPTNIGVHSLKKINSTYYLGADNGFYVSPDGITWKIVDSITHKTGNTTGNAGIIAVNDHTVILGSGYFGHGLWKSDDNGQKFSEIKGTISKNASIHKITKIDQTIYVCVDRWGSNTTPWLYKSDDNGQNFARVFSLTNTDSVNDIVKINNILYVSTSKGLFFSNDDGQTFRIMNSIGADFDVHHVNMFNGKLYAATETGLFVSINGFDNFKRSITFKDQGPVDVINTFNDKIFIDYKSVGVYTNIKK